MTNLKLGSLFDGIGGFPLSASRHDITPVWASEIEPSCINITKRHFPDMKHLGSITEIDGGKIEPVDIITFGSPCQDLSQAGKKAGLSGKRSGLFYEAMRIIKEMRSATNGRYPTWVIWENVSGALSSSNGMDFKSVLETFADTEIPMPRSKRWAGSGMVRGGGCDIAWRTLDSQYWGVPQRRHRIFLVADFGGQRASQICFEPESLRGDIATSRKARKEIARSAGESASESDRNIAIPINTQIATRHKQMGRGTGLGIGKDGDPAFTLQQAHHHAVCTYSAFGETGQGYWQPGIKCLRAEGENRPSRPSNVVVSVSENHRGEIRTSSVVSTLWRGGGKPGQGYPCICVASGHSKAEIMTNISPTLTAAHEQPYIIAIRTAQTSSNGCGIGDVAYTLDGSEPCAIFDCREAIEPIRQDHIVRRLTPLECERLQGFPDDWTVFGADGKQISDSKRYAAIGNSVAIPCVDYLMAGIVKNNH